MDRHDTPDLSLSREHGADACGRTTPVPGQSNSSSSLMRKPRTSPSSLGSSVVLLPREAAQSPKVHKIHILGEDERSKFIAHALSSVYDSVEMLSKQRNSPKYRNIQTNQTKWRTNSPTFEANQAVTRALTDADDSHIDQLIVTGYGFEAAGQIQSVKNRIDENTTVCLMNEGLGVLEDVRNKIFEYETNATPSFLLGHMNHRLAFNRTYDAVTQLKLGRTKLTFAELPGMRVGETQKRELRPDFVENVERGALLGASLAPYDQWLRFKLPDVLFDSVVEPACVLFDTTYQGLLQNPAAFRMMQGLLDEILTTLKNMPELHRSTTIRDYLYGKGVRKFLHGRIVAKRTQPSRLVQRIKQGLPTNINYMNGYFLRRGRTLGIGMPMNRMMREMVKAKQSRSIERLNSFIPMDEMSVPSYLAFRYRTTPAKHSGV